MQRSVEIDDFLKNSNQYPMKSISLIYIHEYGIRGKILNIIKNSFEGINSDTLKLYVLLYADDIIRR